MWHVLKLPAKFFSQRYGPEITQRSQLNETVAGLLSTQLTTGALNLFLAFFYVLAMFFYDWMLTLFCAHGHRLKCIDAQAFRPAQA